MKFRKRLWLLHLLVTGLEIALTMFEAYVQHQPAKHASNWRRTALYVLEAFYEQVAEGSIDPFGFSRTTAKTCTNFFRVFCNLFEVCNNQNK